MLPIILAWARTYAPYIVWPVAAVIGVIGYNVEKTVRGNRETPWAESTVDRRVDRILQENEAKDATAVDSLKEKKFVPKTIFGKNDFDKAR